MLDSFIIQQLVNGLTLGCLYAIIALGYTLIFGVMRLIFFAQGELCMIGAFGALGTASLLRNVLPDGSVLMLGAALLGGVVASVLIGVLAERLAIHPIRRADRTKQLIASLGVSLVLQNIVLTQVSAENLAFPRLLPDQVFETNNVLISPIQAFIIACSLLLMIALRYVLQNSRIGLHIRAVAQSRETAELDGINVNRTVLLTFIIGSVLAGFAGFMMGSYDGVAKYNMGFLPGIKGFTAAILGGFGNPTGAMIGGVLLGLAETLAAGYISSTYKDVIAFTVLVLVILVRPNGILKRGWASA